MGGMHLVPGVLQRPGEQVVIPVNAFSVRPSGAGFNAHLGHTAALKEGATTEGKRQQYYRHGCNWALPSHYFHISVIPSNHNSIEAVSTITLIPRLAPPTLAAPADLTRTAYTPAAGFLQHSETAPGSSLPTPVFLEAFVKFNCHHDVSMRYEDWDILIFPRGSKTPVREFKTACHVVPDLGVSSSPSIFPLRVLKC